MSRAVRPHSGRWLASVGSEHMVCSGSLHDMLGYARGAVELEDIFDRIVHPHDRDRLAVFRAAALHARFGEHSLECRLRRIDGQWLDVRISCLTRHDNGTHSIAGTVELIDPDSAAAPDGIDERLLMQSTERIRSPVFIFHGPALAHANAAALVHMGRAAAGEADLVRDMGDAVAAAVARERDGLCEIEFGGRTWLCHAVVLNDDCPSQPTIAAFCHDVTGIREVADRRVAEEQELTRTLVKEVHHRIKNNLQATIGLLRQNALASDGSLAALDKGISQLLSIAAVHGIQARVHEDRIYLCSVVAEVVRAAQTVWTSALQIEAPDALRLFAIDEQHAVPIALIVNELVTNAAKYTRRDSGSRVEITLDRIADDNARLVVTNRPAQLPDGFDLARCAGLGAGLRLVTSLLPRGLSTLAIDAGDDAVRATLTIAPPVVAYCAPRTREAES